MCCLAFWCTPVALGQLLTRMRLDWKAEPIGEDKPRMSTFLILVITFVTYIIIDNILDIFSDPWDKFDTNDDEEELSTKEIIIECVRGTLSFLFSLYVLVLLIKARGYIRSKYEIPGSGVKDCCASFWCSCCALTQMARHTADYETYNAACCTDTGLPHTAPAIGDTYDGQRTPISPQAYDGSRVVDAI